VRIFELRGRGPASTEELPLLSGYGEGLALYRAGKFAEARLQFQSLQERFGNDGPCALMLSRCSGLLARPPEKRWEGVFRMEHK
jgi:adenylate cyclase